MENSYKIREIKIKYGMAVLIYRLPLVAYLALSIQLTGQIKTRKELVDFVLSRPLADQSRLLGERLLRWENFVKEQPLQVMNIDEIKNILEFKGNGDLRDTLKFVCRVQKRTGNIEGTSLIYTQQHKQDLKTRYQPSYDILHKHMEDFMAICLDILDSLSDIHKREVEKAFYKALASFDIPKQPLAFFQ